MTQRYREIEVAGPSLEMGRQTGEAVREEIRAFAAMAMDHIHQTVSISRQQALAIAVQSAACVEQYAPEMLVEVRGMSESSGVSFEELMLLQVRNQLTSDADSGCTSFAAGPAATFSRQSFVAQNWDNDPALDPLTLVLTRRPLGRPALTTVTQAGLIAYIGFNDVGIGACLNTLPAPARPVGVPHYFTLRAVYEASSLEQAAAAVRRAERAIPANIMLATPQGPADLEVTLDDVRVLQNPATEIVTHTNHCLHPELVDINHHFDELIESRPRKVRIDELIGDGSRPLNVPQIQAALSDHQGFPQSICRHANADPKHGFWETVLSVIIEPQTLRMHIARGVPCSHSYETYCMAGTN